LSVKRSISDKAGDDKGRTLVSLLRSGSDSGAGTEKELDSLSSMSAGTDEDGAVSSRRLKAENLSVKGRSYPNPNPLGRFVVILQHAVDRGTVGHVSVSASRVICYNPPRHGEQVSQLFARFVRVS
jgi:hypothetical protein